MPPPPREEERIEIRRTGERNGRAYDEDIIIDRNEGGRSAPIPPNRRDDLYDSRPLPPPISGYDSPARRGPAVYRDPRDDRDVAEEADYYNQRALVRSYPGEGYHGATRDWAIVDVPPGTRRVRMDGAGGGAQEVTWQRYNGVRRSKFMPDGSDEGYGSEVGRPVAGAGGEIGRRYGGIRDPREGMWTEITKDLVVKEAIIEAGYEFEETDDFYYVIAFLRYVSQDLRHLSGGNIWGTFRGLTLFAGRCSPLGRLIRRHSACETQAHEGDGVGAARPTPAHRRLAKTTLGD